MTASTPNFLPDMPSDSKYGPDYDSDNGPNAPQYRWRVPPWQVFIWGVLPAGGAVVVAMFISQILLGISVSVSQTYIAPAVALIVGGSKFYYVAFVRDEEWNEWDPDYKDEFF